MKHTFDLVSAFRTYENIDIHEIPMLGDTVKVRYVGTRPLEHFSGCEDGSFDRQVESDTVVVWKKE